MIQVNTNQISNKCTTCNKIGHKARHCPNQKIISEKRQIFLGKKKSVIKNKNITKKKKKKNKKSVSCICDSSSDES